MTLSASHVLHAPSRHAATQRRQRLANVSSTHSGLIFARRRISSAASATGVSGAHAPLKPLDDTYEREHTFSKYANWVVPGMLMQGQYPFVAPEVCSSRDEGVQRIREILEAGVSTFVSLVGEVPAQKDMRIGGEQGFLPYKATAELIQSSLNGPPPMELIEGKGLRTPQLNAFLPPKRNRNASLQSQYKPKMPTFVHAPFEDDGTPSDEKLAAVIADLKARVEAGEVLYVHCQGGRGRSGTVTSALLSAVFGISADEALQRTRRAFATRAMETPSPPTASEPPAQDKQAVFVRSFVESKLGIK
uniref:Tyrosine specific protein phosphatases domain-containing protein n=1 Tax=Chlamydomonas euryale TaxID=1486919 RepID=A0A7R9VHW3_9CHLO|mmetsp:Transcript_34787/g.103189  ORF Transcript_34787/g.103189 Transcript_34787/m.103189 type:complete len:304 (+) Transcript_34787:116-1027(+)